MKTTVIRALIFIAVLGQISACSYVKTLFPDKEKDYQFTTEIPHLVLPPDLVGDSIAPIPTATVSQAGDVSPAEKADVAPVETAPTVDLKLVQIELVDAEQGAKHLRIGAPSAIAWRMVGKALSRKSIEVANRNQDEGLFHVQYDPNKQQVEDGSFWDEVVFAVTGFEVTEREYVLKLLESNSIENNRQTDVIVMDKEQKPVTDASGLSLLTLLHDTIKADLAK